MGGAACTIVLRGSSNHVVDEAERSVHDALCILAATIKHPKRIYGGGCTEVDMAAKKTPGKKSIAMASFAKALLQLPMTVADNGGYDAAELITQLRAAHAGGEANTGLDMENGIIGDMEALGIMESYKSKLQVVTSASEAAEMLLRVDDIIKCAPRRRDEMM